MSKAPYRLVEQEVNQLEEQIRSHRIKILRVILLVVIFALIVLGCLYYVYRNKVYTEYEVTESVGRKDSAGTHFESFAGRILKYSNDGAFYIDSGNHLIWNQTYEMQSPIVDICEGYVAIADEKGKKIYIMDTTGSCGEIETSIPIQQIHIANQGMVAVLMEENGVGYIQLYDRTGTFLVGGEIHARNRGYPLDIAISNDGRKMAVTMLDINEGIVKTTVAFYNFGSVGQNEIDNIVSSYSYDDMIIPKVEFLTNDVAVAVGDSQIILYEGTQKPVVIKEIEISRELQSLFYNDNYVGLVFEKEAGENSYTLEVYDLHGTQAAGFDFAMEYGSIEFLGNDEICILNDQECRIYTLQGLERFQCEFETEIYKVIHVIGRRYIFLMKGSTDRVRLK